MANLSLLHENKRKGAVSEHLIANHEAREVFLLSDAGLLFTSKPLDREEKDSYMVTIVLGRKGIIRGKQAVQVKVRLMTNKSVIFQLSLHLKNSIILMMVFHFLGSCY